jgi:hypothetical protein
MPVSADRHARRWWALALLLISVAIGCAPAESRVAPPQRPATGARETGSTTAGDRAQEEAAGAAAPVVAVKPPAVATGDGRVREITFDDLKFDIEKGGEFQKEMITPSIEELNKRTLKLRGFILPTSVFQQSGIKQFVLVRDNQECCFGPGAALYDCVIVEMAPGKTANFSTRVVSVKGKLEIDPDSFRYPDGGHYAIYKMTAEEVR